MGIFFEKPTKGPDVTGGGVWPIRDSARLWNRSGSAVQKGFVVAMATRQGVATEIATNDLNSYIPGASNDTIWNTFIYSTTNLNLKGGIHGVVMDDVISDNKAGKVCLFGLVDAFVRMAVNGVCNPGAPLTVAPSNSTASGFTFTPTVATNQKQIAMFCSFTNGILTTKRLRKVFLHQGLFGGVEGVGHNATGT